MPSCLLAYVDQCSLIKISPQDEPHPQLGEQPQSLWSRDISFMLPQKCVCAHAWVHVCLCNCTSECVEMCTWKWGTKSEKAEREVKRGLLKVAPVVADKLPLSDCVQGFAKVPFLLSELLLINSHGGILDFEAVDTSIDTWNRFLTCAFPWYELVIDDNVSRCVCVCIFVRVWL